MLALAAWAVLAFLLTPSLIVLPIAFGNRAAIVFPPTSFGLAMFRDFFKEPGWVAATWMSLRVSFWVTGLSVLTGVPAAYGLVRGRFAGRRVLIMYLLAPILMPGVVTAMGLSAYFAQIRLYNGELRLVLGQILVAMPFVVVTVLAALRQVDPVIEAAATVMGATRLTVLLRVTLPQIVPATAAGALFAFLISFDEVVISWFVAQPNSITLPIKMFASIQYDVSSILAAISTMLTGVSTLICMGVVLLKRAENAR